MTLERGNKWMIVVSTNEISSAFASGDPNDDHAHGVGNLVNGLFPNWNILMNGHKCDNELLLQWPHKIQILYPWLMLIVER
jgi:hypothetical protein